MRQIKYIVVHCSAGNQNAKAADVVRFHTSKVKGCKGWSKPGYHYFIEKDGNAVNICPLETSSNGVNAKVNPVAINVCYAGGVDTSTKALPPIDNRTPAQKAALRALLVQLKSIYPDARILGHRDFPGVRKACPSFDAVTEYADL